MEQQDIKVEEIDDIIEYHCPDGNNLRSSPNDIDIPITQVDVKGGIYNCPICGYRPSSHIMLTRKKKHHEECIKKRKEKHIKQQLKYHKESNFFFLAYLMFFYLALFVV